MVNVLTDNNKVEVCYCPFFKHTVPVGLLNGFHTANRRAAKSVQKPLEHVHKSINIVSESRGEELRTCKGVHRKEHKRNFHFVVETRFCGNQ